MANEAEGAATAEAEVPQGMTAEEAALPENQAPVEPEADPTPEATEEAGDEASSEDTPSRPSLIDSEDPDDREAQDKPEPPSSIDDVSVPEGSPLPEGHIDSIKEFANERGLTAEQAQALADRDHQMAEANREAWARATDDNADTWYSELQADPVFGKDMPANTAAYNQMLTAVWPVAEYPEVRELLKASGYEYWPPFVKGLAAFAKAHMAEPATVPKHESEPVPSDVALAKKRYPNSPEMWGGEGQRRTA